MGFKEEKKHFAFLKPTNFSWYFPHCKHRLKFCLHNSKNALSQCVLENKKKYLGFLKPANLTQYFPQCTHSLMACLHYAKIVLNCVLKNKNRVCIIKTCVKLAGFNNGNIFYIH